MFLLTVTSRGTSLELSVAAAPEARAPDEFEGCTRGLRRDVGGGEPLGMGDLQAPKRGGPALVTVAAGALFFQMVVVVGRVSRQRRLYFLLGVVRREGLCPARA